MTLPQGVRVKPSSAGGLGGLPPAQIALRSGADADMSRRLEDGDGDDRHAAARRAGDGRDLPGEAVRQSVRLAAGACTSLRERAGVVIKLAGRVDADPVTGQITTTFDDNPQLPFSRLHLEFKSGPRAPLVTPPQCGTYTTHARADAVGTAERSTWTALHADRERQGPAVPAARSRPASAPGRESNSAGTQLVVPPALHAG